MHDVVLAPVRQTLVRGVVTTGSVARAVTADSCCVQAAVAAMSRASTVTAARQAADARQACEVGMVNAPASPSAASRSLARRRDERTRQGRPWLPGPARRAGPRLAARAVTLARTP